MNQSFGGNPHILVIDDDERLRLLLSRYLKENGLVVSEAKDVPEARKLLKLFDFGALIVDVMMPGENGMDFTAELKKTNSVPVLMLTAMGEPQNRISGLECGADDYLTKPFEPKELLLRIQNVLKRSAGQVKSGGLSGSAATGQDDILSFGECSYNTSSSELFKAGEKVRLTPVEDALLAMFVASLGRILSREEIVKNLSGDNSPRSIDVQITRLRSKIEKDSKIPRYLQTIRGKGYILLTD